MEVLSKGTGRTPQAFRSVDQEIVVPESLLAESATSLPLPRALDANQALKLQTDDGSAIEVVQQVQLYAPNGLPPLFFIAGDREVLRNEIIYACVLSPSVLRVN